MRNEKMIRKFYSQVKIIVSMILFLLLACPANLEAAAKLEQFPAAQEAKQHCQLLWRLSGVGKLSTDIVFAPNSNLLFSAGNKLNCINSEGKMLWEMQGKGKGNLGSPVMSESGAIYFASASAIQEGKLNGALGWDFSIYAEGKAPKTPLLARGPGNILYLPLPDALYAIDTVGHYVWMLSPWESTDGKSSKLTKPRTFLACCADDKAFYIVFGDKAGNYKLAAIGAKGEYLWNYWLGDINSAFLLADKAGKIYATVNYNKSAQSSRGSKLNQGKVYCFKNTLGRTPLWSSTFSVSDEISMPALGNNKTLYFRGGNKIYALDAEKGKTLWDTPLLRLKSAPAVSKKGYIYAGSSDGYLYAIKPSGRMAWHRQLEGAIERAPLMGPDNYIYVHTGKGNLYKIKDNFTES